MLINRIVRFISSLRLTVVLLSLAILLVFFGTIAQVNEGLYQAQHRWFHSFLIWWSPAGAGWKIPFLPGGYLVGTALLVNLIAAHIQRFQLTWKKLGIHLTHAGIILLLVGQLITDMLARETTMSFAEGETRNYSESQTQAELVFITDAGGRDEVISMPQQLLARRGEIQNSRLPFTVRVRDFHANAEVVSRDAIADAAEKLARALAVVDAEYASADNLVALAGAAQNIAGRAAVWRAAFAAVGESGADDLVAATKQFIARPGGGDRLRTEIKSRFQHEMTERFTMQGGAMNLAARRISNKEPVTPESFPPVADNGAGRDVVLVPLAEEKETDKRNTPAVVIELATPQGSLGNWVASPELGEQEITVGEKTWRLALRFERIYHPFSVTLLKATHDVYRGTDIPKNFQSRVRIENSGRHESREVDISMNNPLRYGGLTFYQYQMTAGEAVEQAGVKPSSVLQVVRNPGWLTPYVGCVLVAAGLLTQFLMHLVGFIKKRRTA